MARWKSSSKIDSAPRIADLRCGRLGRPAGWRSGSALRSSHGHTTADVIEASVAVAARNRGARVLTSDPDDLRRLDSRLEVVHISYEVVRGGAGFQSRQRDNESGARGGSSVIVQPARSTFPAESSSSAVSPHGSGGCASRRSPEPFALWDRGDAR